MKDIKILRSNLLFKELERFEKTLAEYREADYKIISSCATDDSLIIILEK